MIKNYLKIAWRNLLKNKVTGFINIAGLAIGMAVVMMIGLWLKDELSFNKSHKNYDRIAQVYLNQTFNDQTMTSPAVSLPFGPSLRDDYGADFERTSLASWNFEHVLVNGEKKLLREGMFVQPDYLEIFSLDMLAGNYENALAQPNSIVLSQSLALALFGEEDPMGKILQMDSKEDLKVTGVFANPPYNSRTYQVNYLLVWDDYVANNDWVKESLDNWSNHSFQMFVQLEEKADIAAVSAKIRDIEKVHNEGAIPEVFLFPMERWHLYSDFKNGINTGGRIQFVWMFGIIGLFVLILACINFMNLSTARSEKRAREVGIRKSIGSLRSQLIIQFLSESLLVAFLSMLLAIILMQFSMGAFNTLADKEIAIPWSNPLFIGLLLTFVVLTGLLAGSYPAFYLSSFQPLKVLKGTFRSGRWSGMSRQILVTLQFTVSVALIIGTIVVFQQIQHAKNRPIGYEREGTLHFRNNAELDGKYDILRNELLSSGLVEEFAYSSSPVTNIWSNQDGFDWEGKDPNGVLSFGVVGCSHEFGNAVNWSIKEGRDFSRDYLTDTAALILNEAAVELVGIKDIVGKTIVKGDRPHTVIGVVKDMLMESPWTPVKPTIFHLNPGWVSTYTTRIKEGTPVQDALALLERMHHKHSPSSPFEYKFVDDDYNKKFQTEERIGKLARLFAILAIFISCLGLFGLSAFVAEQRTKEIGVRKVLGASVTNLWAMQSKGFVLLVTLSCLIATPLAWYLLDSWLTNYDYRIQLGSGVFILAAVLALVVTLLTVSYQSIRAALMNPVESLRSE